MARCVSCGHVETQDSPEYRVEDPHRLRLLDCLNSQRQEGRLCDVILIADDARFPAHRCVLAGASPYFRSMFEEFNFSESTNRDVELHSVDSESLEVLLDFIYTGKLHLTNSNVHNIVAAADHLLHSRAKTFCSRFLQTVLSSPSASNEALRIKKSAEIYLMSDLQEEVEKYISKHFQLVANSEDFLLQDKEDLIKLLGCENINEKEEKVMFDACMRWVRHDLQSREQHLEAVLSCVRLPLMSPRDLVEVVRTDELVIKSSPASSLVQEAMVYQLLRENQCSMQSARTCPRVGGQERGLVFCLSGWDTFMVYVPGYDRWYSLQSPVNLLDKLRQQSLGKEEAQENQVHFSLLMVGGSVLTAAYVQSHHEVSRFQLKALLKFELKKNAWSSCSLPLHQTYTTLVECKGLLYACSREGVELFSPESDTWCLIISTHLIPWHFVASDQAHIYCFSLQEGMMEVVNVDNKSSYRQQIMAQSLYVDDVLGVAKMADHEIFLSLRTFSGGVIRRVFHMKTLQWKEVSLCHGVAPLPQPGVHFPMCLDPAELWEVQCDRETGALYVLGLKSTLHNIPARRGTAGSRGSLGKTPGDGVLPFFRWEQSSHSWHRLAALPETLSSSGIKLCISDGFSSMATMVP